MIDIYVTILKSILQWVPTVTGHQTRTLYFMCLYYKINYYALRRYVNHTFIHRVSTCTIIISSYTGVYDLVGSNTVSGRLTGILYLSFPCYNYIHFILHV